MAQEYTYTVVGVEDGKDLQQQRQSATTSTIDLAKRDVAVKVMAAKRGWELFLPWQKLPGTDGWEYNEAINTPKSLRVLAIVHPTSASQDDVTAAVEAFLNR